jgi:hypothetical protein
MRRCVEGVAMIRVAAAEGRMKGRARVKEKGTVTTRVPRSARANESNDEDDRHHHFHSLRWTEQMLQSASQ